MLANYCPIREGLENARVGRFDVPLSTFTYLGHTRLSIAVLRRVILMIHWRSNCLSNERLTGFDLAIAD
jgi:hypothetical protein